MQTQNNQLKFVGQNIYVGIDVHLKSWNVTILVGTIFHKTFTQPPNAEVLVSYLQTNFPGGNYFSAYEAGFSGFSVHYELTRLNVKNIVVNPADVLSTQKEKVQKTDSIDSKKIARELSKNNLKGIHVPKEITMEVRSLLRVRNSIVKDLSRAKQRVKSLLHFYGIKYPERFENKTSHWSLRFIKWLSEDVQFSSKHGRDSLDLLLMSVNHNRAILLEATRKIREISRSPQYEAQMKLICSVPGVGPITGMTFLAEIEDINRFPNTDHLAGYLGLHPTSHSSGDNEVVGEITFRARKQMRNMLIESSWIAARRDPALLMKFIKLSARMERNKAIIRIARKLANRIYYVLKNKTEYVSAIV